MTALLEVKNLQVRVEEREILHGLSLTVNKGEVHAIMGPNGSGKSTLSHVIAGKPGYEVTSGEILFKGENLLEMSPDERAAKGVFLAFQYPVEIPGVATMTFLRTALNDQPQHSAGHAPPRRQCRLLRRREEAQRDSADGAVRAEPVHP
jgi:Fe-S cluster assembly ATP-binding protein